MIGTTNARTTGSRRKLSPREAALLAVAVAAAVAFLLVRSLAVPAYREWRELQVQLAGQRAEYTRLSRNLAYRQSAEEEFARLPGEAFQAAESEQMTLASWLRELESKARRPSLVLVNTKPLPVRRERGYGVYAVKLSVSGRLPEVVQFISDATNGPSITSVSSFSMRAVQGLNHVECAFGLEMVRLPPDTAATGGTRGPARPAPAGPRREGAAGAY